MSKTVTNLSLPRGAMYTGEVDEKNRPHGKGVLRLENGYTIEGVFYIGCADTREPWESNVAWRDGAPRRELFYIP